MLNSQLKASNNAPYIPANIFMDKNIKNEKLFEMIKNKQIKNMFPIFGVSPILHLNYKRNVFKKVFLMFILV